MIYNISIEIGAIITILGGLAMENITNLGMINLCLSGENKEEVIKNLAMQLNETGVISDFDVYYESVLERENLTSTGIGFGIAIPHGKTDAVSRCAVGFGRLKKSLDWLSLDNEPVKMIFLLAVPNTAAGNEHLKIIAGLSRKLMHENFRKKLEYSTNEGEIVDLINTSLNNVV